MNIRSKALYDYLLRVGALTGTPEALARAKQDYRKAYKRSWQQLQRPHKEIRITVTLNQFAAVKTQAIALHLPIATYARNTMLASSGAYPIIPLDTMLRLLQIISMAVNAISQDDSLTFTYSQLVEAEQTLVNYIA